MPDNDKKRVHTAAQAAPRQGKRPKAVAARLTAPERRRQQAGALPTDLHSAVAQLAAHE